MNKLENKGCFVDSLRFMKIVLLADAKSTLGYCGNRRYSFKKHSSYFEDDCHGLSQNSRFGRRAE